MGKNLSNTKEVKVKAKISGRDFSLETGQFAQLADGAVLVRHGESVILVTAVVEDEPKEDASYFPLLVDFEERFYASGKISGSRFYKREGRPSDEAILTARMVDRPIRPLFPKGYKNEVQIVVTALSYDPDSEIEIPAIVGASAALMLTGAPFEGPIGGVKIGLEKDKFVVNPTSTQVEEGGLELIVVGNKERILMVEGEAMEIPSKKLLEAFKLAQKELQATIKVQEDFIKKVGPIEKREYLPVDPALKKKVQKEIGSQLKKAVQLDRAERDEEKEKLENEVLGALEGDFKQVDIKEAFEKLFFELVRELILKKKIRPDKRKPDQIRPITTYLPDLPRSHGSALFQRGNTQLLSIITLASTSKEGLTDTMKTEDTQRFFHHYNFPPFSVNEVTPMRGPGRREIGHGYLGDKALRAVIPSQDEFPYVIRTVSEALSSDGSTSMAAVCSSSMALMDAGVPIKRPVSGIAIGMVSEVEKDKITNYQILTDIQGLEDFLGDMDLKIAGTEKGVTSLQLDTKVAGITFEIIEEALERGDDARAKIREEMNKTINKAREKVSKHAPKIKMLQIDPTRIGDVIGPGGKIINSIIEKTGCEINIEDDGSVAISSNDGEENLKEAIETVKGLGTAPEVGKVYQGKITRVEDFGAFAEYLPGQEGLIHISELADRRVDKVSDVVKLGDEVPVMLIEIDDKGRANLSLRAAK